MFCYLKTCRDFISIVCGEIDQGYRDLFLDVAKNRIKLFHESELPERLNVDLEKFDGKIVLSLLLNQSDHVLNFSLLNDFDVGGEIENDIFRRGMVKKFGANYFDQLTAYMLEKNCQQVEMLTNKTFNKIKNYRKLIEPETE